MSLRSRYTFFGIIIFLFCTGVLLPLSVSYGQNLEQQETDTTDKVVRIIRFVGNNEVKDNTLLTLIRTRTNREFLGIPRFTPWYFIYRLTGRFGEEPSLLNRETVNTDIERIRRYYQSVGFLEASVDTNIVEYKNNRVEVSFLIDEGEPSTIRTIAYSGIPSMEGESSRDEFFQDSPLTENQLNDSTFEVNQRYRENDLSEERNRIINFLKNNGYASAQRDSVIAKVKRSDEDPFQLDVLFDVTPGRIYRFGDLTINLGGPDNEPEYTDRDTLEGEPFTTNGKRIYLAKDEEAQSKFSMLTDQVLFKPGEPFNNSLYVRTINEFQNLGMVGFREFGLSEDGGLPDYSQEEIPVLFSMRTQPRHSVNANLFGLRRYGYGSGAGVTYTNNNLLGKAENLQLGFNGSFEYVASSTLREFRSDQEDNGGGVSGEIFRSYEARADYTLPSLVFPFAALDDHVFFSNARTRYSLVLGRSNQLLFDINSELRFNIRYEVNHNERYTSLLDLFELDLLDSDPSPQFRQSLEEQFLDENGSSLIYERILEDYRPQVSSILRYTFRSQRTDLIKRNYGYFSEYSVAFGGNVPYLIDRYIATPDRVDGEVPSLTNLRTNTLSYSRFLKFTADYRRYLPVGNETVLGYRGFAGYAHPYGKSTTIPLNRRFFAGGTNDVRGWDIYSLGPGSLPLDDVTVNGGEIKLIAQTELRQNILNDVLSADWIGALFTDAGNVWYGPRNTLETEESSGDEILEDGKFQFDRFYDQIAVGTGFGIRMDWEYVVARFDFAFRAHDLQEGWFNNRKLYFSFGIGHSF